MELSRMEAELRKPKNWGKQTYLNLLERSKTLSHSQSDRILTLSSSIRQALELHTSISGPLNASDVINELTEEECCRFFEEYSQCSRLILQKWSRLSYNVIRSISMNLCESLLELDLSYSSVQSSQLEIFLIRSTNLEILKLTSCQNLEPKAYLIIVQLIFRHLKELYLNNIFKLNNEALIVLGGGGVISSQALYKLIALDISDCPSVEDKGLIAIANGCKRLSFLNLANCLLLTDASILQITKNCPNMKLISCVGLAKLTNKAAIAMGRSWPNLVSLNLARCPLISDKGIKPIALGCKNLQSVNLAGLIKISEESMFILSDQCKGLLILNLTGCERITVNGLNNLVMGLPFVQHAVTFTGFKPIDAHIEAKLTDQLNMINRAEKEAQDKIIRDERERLEQEEEERAKFIYDNACLIQNYLSRYNKRMYFYHLWEDRKLKNAACMVQRIYRGYRGRLRAEVRRQEVKAFYENSPLAVKIQRNVRGYLTRLKNRHVSKTIIEMYIVRRKEVFEALAVKLQSIARFYLTKKRISAYKELKRRRMMNMNSAILSLQQLARSFLSKLKLFNLRTKKKNLEEARRVAGLKIKEFCIEGMKRFKARLSGDALKKFFREKWTASIKIQKYFRGFRSREFVRKYKIWEAVRYYAARAIQRIFRGTRVLYWRDIRLNVIAAFVLDRHYVERRDAVEASRLRYKKYVQENMRDSASDPDDEEEPDFNWIKHYDNKRKLNYWQNYVSNEITFDEPIQPLANEKSMIGKRIRVFWVVQAAWYEGTITRYHIRKKRHRVEYDDGDHEWINLEAECDRVQIELEDGSWAMYVMFQSDAKAEEIRKMDEKNRREKYKEQAFRDALQWKPFVDDNTKKIMFISSISGELRTGMIDAFDWVVQDDGYGFPCFYNSITESTVYEDPRFVMDVEEDLFQQRKYVMQELRLGVYLCKELWEEYTHALELNDEKFLFKVMNKIRNSPKVVQLSSFIIRAKALYEPSSIVDKNIDQLIWEEIEYSNWLVGQLNGVAHKCELMMVERRSNKLKVIDKISTGAFQQVFCRYCRRETKRHLEFCPNCGKPQVFF